MAQGGPRGAGFGTRRAVDIAFALVAVALLVLAVYLVLGPPDLARGSMATLLILFGIVAVSGFALLFVRGLIHVHFVALDRLRGAIVTFAGNQNAVIPVMRGEGGGPEIRRLHGALTQLSAREARDRAAPDHRLQAVMATIREAILVVTEQGQVSLVNYPARQLLGAERVRVGTSVFAALKRDPLIEAMKHAARTAAPRDATLETVEGQRLAARIVGLGEHGGAVVSFPAETVEHRAELECDLALHDLPPPPPPIADETPLEDLPVLVLDTETTGLDVTQDRIVSIGAVRLHGTRIYRSISFDRLVHPGRPIPPRSTAVHGITDAMVAGSRHFPAVFADLAPLLDGTAIVGHNIPYDLAMLRRECGLAEVPWEEPPFLDTLVLVAALDTRLLDLDLDGLAAHFGVDVHGRHTALGDCLVTAEIYARLIPQLRDRGVATYGAARTFSQKAKAILDRQKKSGW